MYVKRKPSVLQRPELVAFNVDNPEHRAAYLAFLKDNKWPIRFKHEPPFTSVPNMVMWKLAIKACEAEGTIDEDQVLSKSTFGVSNELENAQPQQLRGVSALMV